MILIREINSRFCNVITKIPLSVLIITSLLYANPAQAWGKFGHVVACEIAYREMTPTAREELVRLIGVHGEYSSFNRACLFADRFPRKHPASHFVNYDRSKQTVTDASCGEADECVISAIAKDLTTLSDASIPDIDRATAMILLGHWVGDIHQPLHVSYKDDRGGNSIKKRGRCGASNLHAVWDNCIVEERVLGGNFLTRLFGWEKFTRAYRAADRLESMILDEQRTEWVDSEIWEWAAESYAITTDPTVGYCTKRNNACWYDTNNKRLDRDEEQRTIAMTNEYLDQFTETVEGQLMRAGVRLGHLLNLALDPP